MADENNHGHNITNLINDLKKSTVKIFKRNSSGDFVFHEKVDPGKFKGPLDHIDKTNLRFVVEDPPADGIYFGIVEGGRTPGEKPHIDGEVGHPPPDE